MQIILAGVVYEVTAEALFLFICGVATIYALIEAGIAWYVGPAPASIYDY